MYFTIQSKLLCNQYVLFTIVVNTCIAHPPNVAAGGTASGGASALGGAGLSAPKASSVSDLAHAANMMTAWTDKLYTENMGCIFTSPAPPAAGVSGVGLMNNGRQDTSPADVQKLQQQLQDIKDQVIATWTTSLQLNCTTRNGSLTVWL